MKEKFLPVHLIKPDTIFQGINRRGENVHEEHARQYHSPYNKFLTD
jgi:hypothetical protein